MIKLSFKSTDETQSSDVYNFFQNVNKKRFLFIYFFCMQTLTLAVMFLQLLLIVVAHK